MTSLIWRSRVASAFGSADIEVKAATLEAARADLERQREEEKALLGEKVLTLLLDYEAATRRVKLVESQLQSFNVSREVFRIRYRLGEGTTEQLLGVEEKGDRLSYLERLIETNKKTDTRWILSCREDDYRAYSGRLKVANVRLKTMNLKQRKEFEKKRIKTADFSALPPDERREELIKTRRFLAALKKAEDKEETFLSNPYYLALWLQKVFYEKTFKPDIASIEELHEIELRREIAKVIYKNPNPYEKVDSHLIENTKNVLSVISYYLLEVNLSDPKLHKIKIT